MEPSGSNHNPQATPEATPVARRDLRPEVLITLFLAAGAFLLYVPSLSNRFVDYDDPGYVSANPMVQRGLTAEGVKWAFTTSHATNWLPVTWLSYMLDVELYGNGPVGHHATNAILHGLNTGLLYLAVLALTSAPLNPTQGERLRAAAVAVLFAAHPIRVESVSWVSERKDVLSGLFFMLALLCYGGYYRYAGRSRATALALYVLTMLSAALGLMSKTMLVTLPFLLLLLDFWPLGRLREGRKWPWLVVFEKLPILALCVVASGWTYVLQREGRAMWGARDLTLDQRAANAVVSVARYFGKTVWPTKLSVFYPHPGDWPGWQVAASTALVMLISVLALWQLRRRPYLAVGWFWFLGMLVPVIGIVQVGLQSMADRYMYLPGIGLVIAAVWGTADLLRRYRRLRPAAAVVTGTVVVALAVQTVRQQRHWETTYDLFAHALAVDPNNWLAHDMVGMVYSGRGDEAAAIPHFRQSIRLNPNHPHAYHHLGVSLKRLGRRDEAIEQFRKALEVDPDLAVTHLELAVTLAEEGRFDEAEPHFREAVRLDSYYPTSYANWGQSLLEQGRNEEAAAKFREALRLAPDDPFARHGLERATSPGK